MFANVTTPRECNATKKLEMVEQAQQCINENMVVIEDSSKTLSANNNKTNSTSRTSKIGLYGNCQTCQAHSTIPDIYDENQTRYLFNGIFFTVMGVLTMIFWFKISQLYQDKFVPEPPTGRRRIKLSAIFCRCFFKTDTQQQQTGGQDQQSPSAEQQEQQQQQPEWLRRFHQVWDEHIGRRIQERRQRQHTPNDPTLNHMRRLEARRNNATTRRRQTSDIRGFRSYNNHHHGQSATADATGTVHHHTDTHNHHHTNHNRQDSHNNSNHRGTNNNNHHHHHGRTIDDELNEFTVQRIMVVALAQAEGNNHDTDNDSTSEDDEDNSAAL